MNLKINFTLHSSHSLQFLHETKWYDNTWCERPKVWGESWSYYLTIHFLKVIWNNWEYEGLAWNRMICRYLTQKVESWGKKRKLAGRPFCFSLSKLLLLYSASTSSTSSYHVQDQDRWVKAILCPPSTLLLTLHLHLSFFENRKLCVTLLSFHVQGWIFGSRLLCVPLFCS